MPDERDSWIAEADVKLDDAIEHLKKAAAEAEGSVSTSIAAAMRHLTEAKSKLRGEI